MPKITARNKTQPPIGGPTDLVNAIDNASIALKQPCQPLADKPAVYCCCRRQPNGAAAKRFRPRYARLTALAEIRAAQAAKEQRR